MARWGLDKVAAAHLLEALRASSDHLRDLAIGEAARVTSGGRATSVMYAHVRRLRTYVQRCASACTEVVALDLDDDDRNLLAACAVFEIASLDRKLSGAPRP